MFTGDGARLYDGSDGGVWSTNFPNIFGTIPWANLNATLALTQFYPNLSMHPTDPAITLAGTDAQRARWLPAVARGEAIAAFALSEPGAGSDAAALSTTARRDGAHWVLEGEKTWISNGGIADVYCVFARTGEAPGAKGISAFVVPADAAVAVPPDTTGNTPAKTARAVRRAAARLPVVRSFTR